MQPLLEKMSQDFLSQFPLAQISLDLRWKHGTAASSWEGMTSSFGFPSMNASIDFMSGVYVREDTSLDGEWFMLDDQGFLSTTRTTTGGTRYQYDESGISNRGLPSDFWDKDGNSRTYADQILLGGVQHQSSKTMSHAENLIKIAPHLRHISPDSLDMDRVTAATGGAISSTLASPFFQHCMNSLGSTSAISGKNKKRQKQVMDAEIASFLSQKLNRQIAAELAEFVGAMAHEMPLEEFASLENTLFTKLFSLVNSKDSNVTDRMAGVSFNIDSFAHYGFRRTVLQTILNFMPFIFRFLCRYLLSIFSSTSAHRMKRRRR